MRRGFVLLLVAAALLLSSCLTSPTRVVLPAQQQSVAPGRDVTRVIDGGEVTIHVPPTRTGVSGLTGVIVLHSLGNSRAEPAEQGWSKLADQRGFVAIYPERGDSWNAGLCCGEAAETDRDDVGWLAEVMSSVRAAYRLRTIDVVGFSNGGMMAERLVSERPDVTSCIAVWGAAPEMPTPGLWSGRATIFEGEIDNIVPRSGGRVLIGQDIITLRPAAETGQWLLGAQLRRVSVAGYGHKPPAGWPELAWKSLAGC